jgi:hypothetical protein
VLVNECINLREHVANLFAKLLLNCLGGGACCSGIPTAFV